MTSPASAPTDFGLAAALVAHPDAQVTGVRPSGEFCALPPELGSAHEVIQARSVFEMVPQSEWPKVAAGWMQAQQHGSHAGTLIGMDGDEWSMLTFDARERFGIFVRLMAPGASLAETSKKTHQSVIRRFGTCHRDVLSNFISLDEGARSLLGWELEEAMSRDGRDYIHPDDLANAEANWLDALVAPGEPQRWRGRHLHRDGSYRWIEFTTTSLLEHESYVLSEMMDISEEMAAADSLRQRDELLARLNDALPVGVIQVDGDHHVVYTNRQLPGIVGREPKVTFAEQFEAVTSPDGAHLNAALVETLTTGTDADLDVRLQVGEAGTVDRVCAISLRSLRHAGQITGAVLTVSDITEATSLRHELEHQARFDRLTGVYNRAATLAALEHILAENGAHTSGAAVLFLDLDRFKQVNDALGHAAGDKLLMAVADRLRGLVRGDDLVGRLGGDEFVVVCPGADHTTARAIARRITEVLAEPFAIDDMTVGIGASVGLARSADGHLTADKLVAAADAAMYDTKRSRRSSDGMELPRRCPDTPMKG